MTGDHNEATGDTWLTKGRVTGAPIGGGDVWEIGEIGYREEEMADRSKGGPGNRDIIARGRERKDGR